MKALVTGGGGFLGGAIVRKLIARGDSVRSFARGHYPELSKLGVDTIRGDIGVLDHLVRAAEGCDVVVHVAAKAGVWGPPEEFYRTNVAGTENVLAACRRGGVRRLVYTSSPSVIFNGKHMEGVDESVPYPSHYDAAYPETKARAEQMVLRANSADFATVALRPHLIWGPDDPHLIPRIIDRARRGRLRQVGSGDNRVHIVYVDNAADAHLLAVDRLAPGSAIAGKAYFIADGEPRPLWDVINRILAAAGLPPVTREVPAHVAYATGAVLEGIYRLFRLANEPPMTRFLARELATAHWFDLTAARRDLGYTPAISFEEGLRRLQESLRR